MHNDSAVVSRILVIKDDFNNNVKSVNDYRENSGNEGYYYQSSLI